MNPTSPHLRLTHDGALALLQAAMKKAVEMKQPQCIAVVDDGCNLLAFVRMDGARVLSVESATRKAMTAASNRGPTGGMESDLGMRLGITTGGKITNLKGGLPIVVDGKVIGGIGVGSGTGDQDREVANAALAAFPGAQTF